MKNKKNVLTMCLISNQIKRSDNKIKFSGDAGSSVEHVKGNISNSFIATYKHADMYTHVHIYIDVVRVKRKN